MNPGNSMIYDWLKPLSDPEPPQTTIQDRHYLCLTIEEYQNFAEAVSTQSYLNRDGQICKLNNATIKKLKNLRYGIKKSKFLTQSLIWKEQLRLIEAEINKRQRHNHGDYSR